jgi:hypothetical protein
MNENEDLTQRLRALGEQAVDPRVAAGHLAAMTAPRRSWFAAHRVRTAGAFLAGLLIGGTGLATAGALPGPVQNVAHTTLGAVGVNVPGADRHQGPECGGTVKNHGQYVKSQPKGQRSAAAKSPCGKPLRSGSDPGDGAKSGKSECQGRPPWAGAGTMDKAAKQAAQAQRRANCGGADAEKADAPDQDDKVAPPAATKEPAEPSVKVAPAEEPKATTTTVPVDETTTTTSTTTTTTAPDTTDPTLGEILPVPES